MGPWAGQHAWEVATTSALMDVFSSVNVRPVSMVANLSLIDVAACSILIALLLRLELVNTTWGKHKMTSLTTYQTEGWGWEVVVTGTQSHKVAWKQTGATNSSTPNPHSCLMVANDSNEFKGDQADIIPVGPYCMMQPLPLCWLHNSIRAGGAGWLVSWLVGVALGRFRDREGRRTGIISHRPRMDKQASEA